MKKDIYKIDNYFIPWGIVLLVTGVISFFAGFQTWQSDYFEIETRTKTGKITSIHTRYVEASEKVTEKSLQKQNPNSTVRFHTKHIPMVRLLLSLSGFLILCFGIYFRRIENKIIQIWNVLEKTKEVKVDQLAVSLGIARGFILENLSKINIQQNAYYVYDSNTDKIIDGKLKIHFTMSEECGSCGNINQKNVTLDLSETFACSYCGTQIKADKLNDHKLQILNNKEDNIEPPSKFNWGIFVLLLVFFWPGAIYYAIKNSKNYFKNINIDQKSILENIQKYNQVLKN
ncbi:MAG: hypothetical protein OEZ13_08990 [Spirochaetia bacterium]|nr:hypothetical protein [Spirochaetia bacterium]